MNLNVLAHERYISSAGNARMQMSQKKKCHVITRLSRYDGGVGNFDVPVAASSKPQISYPDVIAAQDDCLDEGFGRSYFDQSSLS
jgi:hypothetical protein